MPHFLTVPIVSNLLQVNNEVKIFQNLLESFLCKFPISLIFFTCSQFFSFSTFRCLKFSVHFCLFSYTAVSDRIIKRQRATEGEKIEKFFQNKKKEKKKFSSFIFFSQQIFENSILNKFSLSIYRFLHAKMALLCRRRRSEKEQ